MAKKLFTGEFRVQQTFYEHEVEEGKLVYDWYDSDEWYDTLEEAIDEYERLIDGELIGEPNE